MKDIFSRLKDSIKAYKNRIMLVLVNKSSQTCTCSKWSTWFKNSIRNSRPIEKKKWIWKLTKDWFKNRSNRLWRICNNEIRLKKSLRICCLSKRKRSKGKRRSIWEHRKNYDRLWTNHSKSTYNQGDINLKRNWVLRV